MTHPCLNDSRDLHPRKNKEYVAVSIKICLSTRCMWFMPLILVKNIRGNFGTYIKLDHGPYVGLFNVQQILCMIYYLFNYYLLVSVVRLHYVLLNLLQLFMGPLVPMGVY